MSWVKAIELKGKHCHLRPLSKDDNDELIEAVKDGELWQHWYTSIPSPDKMAQRIDQLLQQYNQGTALPFSIIQNNKAVGMTSYVNIDEPNRRLEIGGTWIRKSCQKTGINLEAKSMLLTHAFEVLDAYCVIIISHYLNHASKRSIERLGAKLDGILRNHMVMPNGTKRDTCIYSIIDSEWPVIKTHLNTLLKN